MAHRTMPLESKTIGRIGSFGIILELFSLGFRHSLLVAYFPFRFVVVVDHFLFIAIQIFYRSTKIGYLWGMWAKARRCLSWNLYGHSRRSVLEIILIGHLIFRNGRHSQHTAVERTIKC